MQNTQKTNGITKTVHTDIYDRQESVEVEETELVEESTVGQVIVGDDHEYYLILNLNGPDVDVEKVDNVQILRNDDGTETVLLEIDELNESELPSDHYRKQNDYHGVEVVDIDKHGKIMQQLFGNPAGSDPYQLGRYRRNRVYGTYSCPECDQTFINTARLERHLAVHQISGSFQCPLCQKVYKYEYNLFYHWRRTCHELSELIPAERRKTMDVNVLRSMVLKFARKKADEAPPPVMKIGINPNLLFKSDTFGLIDMQAPLSTQSVYSGVPCKQCGVKISNSVIQWHVAMHRGIIPVDARSGSGEHFCSLCGQMFRQHYSLIKHWRSSCTEIQARLSNARDISMDDETLKDMVTDIMRELGEEYSQRFGGISHDDDGEGVSAQDLFLSADKDKDLSVVDYQQDALTNRYSSHEMLTHLEAGDEAEIINHDEHGVPWSYLDQAGDAASTSEPNPVRTKWSSTHGMVQCSVCSRTFVNMARLERHIAGFHATTGSHPCVLCGNRFKYDYNLLSHYRRSCPYTKLYIDLEKREQFDALALRRAVRALAQRNLQLSSAQKKMIANKREIPDNSPASFPHFRTRPPFELLVMRPDLPNGKSCPVCGVVFYGERAVERHVKAVHPSEVRHHIQNDTATKKDTETATSTKQRCTETREKSGSTLKQADDSDNVEPPPTLAPEVPVQEPVVTSEPIIRRVCRIEEDADGNQIFIDENGEVIELGEDEEVQIQFDDIESVQHLFETGQLTIANDEQAIILEGNLNDSKYCYNVSYGDSNSSILPTSGTRFVEGEKVADERSKRARKQEFEGNQQHYGCYFVIHKECETDMKRRLCKRTYALH
ncbi:Zinc finger C2H2 type family protein [Brugia pahangi]